MKKKLIALSLFFATVATISAQHIEFEEYDLDNGLHVILQQDNSAPVVTTGVMYHVGSKDESPDRTGFAHFFEHLLFEGTQHIGRGEWFKLVSANGGQNNANTSADRTYYYETFPSNNLQLALWMESERMLHPVINQIGVDTQNGVIKEEKRLSYDNRPYGQILKVVLENLFTKHHYRWSTIGSMEHLDAATLEEFQTFFKKYYIPNNAVLVVSGDFDKAQAKQWIGEYFASIPKGVPVVKEKIVEDLITTQRDVTFEDPNIQLPGLLTCYRTPSMKDRDAYILDMISNILSNGKSSRLYERMVDKEKIALDIAAIPIAFEDYGIYIIFGLPMQGKTVQDLLVSIDEEIVRLQTELISEEEYTKLQNKLENRFVSENATIEGVAHNLASYSILYKDVNLINKKIEIYRSVTREEIRDIAKKYLSKNQQITINYLPVAK